MDKIRELGKDEGRKRREAVLEQQRRQWRGSGAEHKKEERKGDTKSEHGARDRGEEGHGDIPADVQSGEAREEDDGSGAGVRTEIMSGLMEDRLGQLLSSQQRSVSELAGPRARGSPQGREKEGQDGPPQVFGLHAAALERLTERVDLLVERLSSQTAALQPLIQGDVEAWRTWPSYLVLAPTGGGGGTDCEPAEEGRSDSGEEVGRRSVGNGSEQHDGKDEEAEAVEASVLSFKSNDSRAPPSQARHLHAKHVKPPAAPGGLGTLSASAAAPAGPAAAEGAEAGSRHELGAEFAWADRFNCLHV